MKSITVQIHVDRAEAIRAGQDRWGEAVVEVSPSSLSQEVRDTLAQLPSVGGHLDLTCHRGTGASLSSKAGDATVRRVIDLLSEWQSRERRHRAEDARERDNATAEWLRLPEHQLVTRKDGSWQVCTPPMLDLQDERVASRISRLRKLAEDCESEEAESLARIRKGLEAAEARRQSQLSEWEFQLCTPAEQVGRLANLVSDEEILARAEARVFAPLDDFPLHCELTADEVRDARDFDFLRTHGYITPERGADAMDAPYDIRSSDVHCADLSAEERAWVREMRDAMRSAGQEEASFQPREHVGCVHGEILVRRRSVLVSLDVGGWLLSREYSGRPRGAEG